MIKKNKIISVVIFMVMIGALFIPMNVEAQAEAPEWEEGDSWTMGFEVDIDDIFAPGLEEIRDEFDDDFGDEDMIKDFDFDFYGNAESTTHTEVIEVGEEHYILEIDSETEFNMGGSVEITVEFPKEGEDGDDPQEFENRTISGSVDAEFVQTIVGEATLEKSTLALESLELDIGWSLDVDVEINGFPDIEKMEEEGIVSYTDYEGGIEFSFDLSLEYAFEPALDFFNFPIEENSDWESTSNMTGSGTYEGIFDIYGLPEFMMDEIEQDLGMEFPIIFEDHEFEDSEDIAYGEIKEVTEEVNVEMKCIGTDEIILQNGETTDVYLLEFDVDIEDEEEEPSFVMKYSPEYKNIVSMEMSFENTPLAEYMTDETMSMELIDSSFHEEDDDDDNGIPFVSSSMVMISVMVATMISFVLKKNRNVKQ